MKQVGSSSTGNLEPFLRHEGHGDELSFSGRGPVAVVGGFVDGRLLDHLVGVDGHASPDALM